MSISIYRTSGQMMILATLLMVAILGLIGAAVDAGHLVLERQNLQNALDSAALSTVSRAYYQNADAQTTLPSLLYGNVSVSTANAVLTVTYPYQDDSKQLYVAWTVPQHYLFNRYLESSSRVYNLHSHAAIKPDQSEWPYFQDNDQHNGENSGATFAPPLVKAWEFTAAGNTRTQAVIKNGVVYFGAGTYLYAVAANTGTEQWKYNTGLVDGCTPVITGNQIFIGSNYGYDTVYCINLAGGKVWSTKLKNIGTTTALAVDDHYVYEQSTADGALYVFDKTTGQPIKPSLSLPVDGTISRLNTGLAGPGGTGGFSAPALYNQKVFFATGNGNCMAYNIGSWSAPWSITLSGGGNLDSPMIYNSKLYYGGGSKVYCLNPETGSSVWQTSSGSRASSIAAASGVVIVGTNGDLRAMNADTGANAWSAGGSNRYSVAAIANGYVYSVNAQNNKGLRMFKLSDGSSVQIMTDSLDAYYRDNGPAIGWGLVVCPGNTTKKITAYRPTHLGNPYLMK